MQSIRLRKLSKFLYPYAIRLNTVREKYEPRLLRHLLCVLPFIVFAIRRVLPHTLHGNPSQNLAAKGAKQSKAVYFAVRRGERRSACRVARASLSTMHHRKIGAFDRVRITPLQYTVKEKYEPRLFVAARSILRAFGRAGRRAFSVLLPYSILKLGRSDAACRGVGRFLRNNGGDVLSFRGSIVFLREGAAARRLQRRKFFFYGIFVGIAEHIFFGGG